MKRRVALRVALLPLLMAVLGVGSPATYAFAPDTQEHSLFRLTNQDRTSNGVPALVWSNALWEIARDHPESVCGITVRGRAQDMMDRNYFSHQIPPCGAVVFAIEDANGIRYRSAGENVGWTAGNNTTAPTNINNAFMQSSEHRKNILNPNFDQVGMGVAQGTAADNCCAGASTVMFAQVFIQSVAAPPPPPPPPPPPVVVPSPSPVPSPVEVVPTPTAIPTPTPSPSPLPSAPPAVHGVEVTDQGPRAQGLFEIVVDLVIRHLLNL